MILIKNEIHEIGDNVCWKPLKSGCNFENKALRQIGVCQHTSTYVAFYVRDAKKSYTKSSEDFFCCAVVNAIIMNQHTFGNLFGLLILYSQKKFRKSELGKIPMGEWRWHVHITFSSKPDRWEWDYIYRVAHWIFQYLN